MPARRIEAGPLLVLVGSVLLLVALFLEWYEPGLTAWEVFELLDLVLAGLALGAMAGAAAQLGFIAGPDPRVLPWVCGAAFVLVIATVLNPPPGMIDAPTSTGLWLAVAGTVLMGLGALLTGTRVRISVDVEGRRQRVPVDRRAALAAGSARSTATTDGPFDQAESDDDADERPAYRMSFDPPEAESKDDPDPLSPDEPWADPPLSRKDDDR